MIGSTYGSFRAIAYTEQETAAKKRPSAICEGGTNRRCKSEYSSDEKGTAASTKMFIQRIADPGAY